MSIPTDKLSFFTWLLITYGDINRDIITEKVQKILETFYELQSLNTDAFEPILEFEQLEIVGNRPYTHAHIVDFGVTITPKTHDFETALINWCSIVVNSRTWDSFKTHCTTARRNLKKGREKTCAQKVFTKLM